MNKLYEKNTYSFQKQKYTLSGIQDTGNIYDMYSQKEAYLLMNAVYML